MTKAQVQEFIPTKKRPDSTKLVKSLKASRTKRYESVGQTLGEQGELCAAWRHPRRTPTASMSCAARPLGAETEKAA